MPVLQSPGGPIRTGAVARNGSSHELGPAEGAAASSAAGPSNAPAAVADVARATAEDMGAKVLSAAHNIAQMTDFEGHAVKASGSASGSADGQLGEAMYERFRAFDSKYLQPLFGRGQVAYRSGELRDDETPPAGEHSEHRRDGSESQPPP